MQIKIKKSTEATSVFKKLLSGEGTMKGVNSVCATSLSNLCMTVCVCVYTQIPHSQMYMKQLSVFKLLFVTKQFSE